MIFEEAGAGAVVRIWMTQGPGVSAPLDPAIRMRVRLDGEAEPRIDLPLHALFDGTTPGFSPPLAYDRERSSGGNVLYVPIPYRRGCKISLVGAEHARLWFQVTFHRLAQPGSIATYMGAEDLSPWRALLARAGSDPWPDAGAPGAHLDAGNASLSPGDEIAIPAPRASGYLRSIRLKTSVRGAERLRLRLRFDGELRADLPLADFFAVRGAPVPPRSLLVGQAADGFLYAYFPAPFFASARVEIVDAGAPGSRPVRVDWRIGWNAELPPADSGRFGADFRVTAETSPDGPDLPLLSVDGRGKWIGLFAEIGSVRTLSREVLEGDERIYLDGSRHPGIYGTGVEDLFNGGFYFDLGPFSLPLHGAPAHRITPRAEDVTSAYRLFLSDAIPFRSSIRAGLETGPTGNLSLRARTVAYYYSRPEPALAFVDRLVVGDGISSVLHGYEVVGAECEGGPFTGRFEGGPWVALEEPALACAYSNPGGRSTFGFHRPSSGGSVRLRRRLDAREPNPPADVYVNGVRVGTFPFQEANSFRRLREVDLDLPPVALGGATDLSFEIVPRLAPGDGTSHTEVSYELWTSR